MGRAINIYDLADSGAWVGRIVDNRRIDGRYEGGGEFPFVLSSSQTHQRVTSCAVLLHAK